MKEIENILMMPVNASTTKYTLGGTLWKVCTNKSATGGRDIKIKNRICTPDHYNIKILVVQRKKIAETSLNSKLTSSTVPIRIASCDRICQKGEGILCQSTIGSGTLRIIGSLDTTIRYCGIKLGK